MSSLTGATVTGGPMFDLTNKTLSNQDTNQYLGQSSTANPLLDLANEIQGMSGTAASRGTASYGGGAGSPVLGADGKVAWQPSNFQSMPVTTPVTSGPGAGAGG